MVLVVVDTLRRDHLIVGGRVVSAARSIGRLASEGAVLDALSPSSWTKPSVASILTGLHPLRHQTIGQTDALPEAAVTLAEMLRSRGYATAAVVGNRFLGVPFGFDQGFDVFRSFPELKPSASRINGEVARISAGLRTPFFLYVHYMEPHSPYVDPDAPGGRAISAGDLESSGLDPALVRQAIALYDAEIRHLDEKLGRLLDELARMGLLRNAVVVVTADHGEEFGEHGGTDHGRTLYEEVTRVPLVISAPGLVAPGSRPGRVSLLDIVPTILSLTGAPDAARGLDGQDLSPVLRDASATNPPERPHLLHIDLREKEASLALVRGARKLVRSFSPPGSELFDLERNPAEQDGRFAPDSPDAKELLSQLAAEHARLSAHALPRRLVDDVQRVRELSALGYLTVTTKKEERVIPRAIPVDTPGR